MNKSYVIAWKSRINGRAGKGTKVFGFDEASRLAEELNSGYPGIHHEPVEAEHSPGTSSVPEPADSETFEPAATVVQNKRAPNFAFSA